jgi:hypothetical protein
MEYETGILALMFAAIYFKLKNRHGQAISGTSVP